MNVYWDSCVWIRLINGEPESDLCQSVMERAQQGGLKIWTSSLTLAEVYKFKCDVPKSLAEHNDRLFEEYFDSDFVVEVQVDHDIATLARNLCRRHAKLKKPNDGIHLASAVMCNVDEFHTFDADDLLVLAGQVQRLDGVRLDICKPRGPKGTQNVLQLGTFAPRLGHAGHGPKMGDLAGDV